METARAGIHLLNYLDPMQPVRRSGMSGDAAVKVCVTSCWFGFSYANLTSITACDQCRKSKCKCEIPNPHEPCKNCLVLGTRMASNTFSNVISVTHCGHQVALFLVPLGNAAHRKDTSMLSRQGCIRQRLCLA